MTDSVKQATALEIHAMEGSPGWKRFRAEVSEDMVYCLLRLTQERDPEMVLRYQEKYKALSEKLEWVKKQVEVALEEV